MKVIIWGINYAPEPTGIGPYNADLCEYLAERGHGVSMVTSFPYYPAWKKSPEDRHRIFRKETRRGVSIFRCWHYVPERPNAWKRILHEASFITTSFIRLLFLPRPDLLVIISPPLLLGPAAWLAGLIKRCPFHFHVQDMQPDAALALGLLKPGLLSRFLHKLEAFTCRRARSVSGITSGMLQLFSEKKIPSGKQYLLPNWIIGRSRLDESETSPGEFRRKFKIDPNAFLVLYSGNLGAKQGLDIILDTAQFLKTPTTEQKFAFVIAGQGAAEAHLRSRIESDSIPVQLIPLQPERTFVQMLRDADLCLVTQQPGSGALFFPSKLITLLSAGRPVVTVADQESELAAAVRNGRFGQNVPPGDPVSLASTLLHLAKSPPQLDQLGKAGKEWVKQFSREAVLGKFADYIERNRNPNLKITLPSFAHEPE